MRHHILPIALSLAAIGTLVAGIAWGNTALALSEVAIVRDDIPASFAGFRIAQVSDLHNTSFGRDNEKLLTALRAAKPDIIVLTGDLVDSRRPDIALGLAFAAEAVKIAPTYFVSGNHEGRMEEYDAICAGLAERGVCVLENAAVELVRNGDRITLVGIADVEELTVTAAQLRRLVPRDGFTVLLAHRPHRLPLFADAGVSLAFSGHAHGGQFRFPLIGGLYAPGQGIFPRYTAGLYRAGTTDLYVSRGLGNSRFPFRLGNRPELVVATLNPSISQN